MNRSDTVHNKDRNCCNILFRKFHRSHRNPRVHNRLHKQLRGFLLHLSHIHYHPYDNRPCKHHNRQIRCRMLLIPSDRPCKKLPLPLKKYRQDTLCNPFRLSKIQPDIGQYNYHSNSYNRPHKHRKMLPLYPMLSNRSDKPCRP